MNVSRPASWFLIIAGVFNIVIWPRFIAAVIADDRAWSGDAWASAPTSFLWVHVVLVGSAVLIAAGVLFVGVRALRRASR